MPTRLYNKLGQAQDVELGGGDLFKYQDSGWSLDKPASTLPELDTDKSKVLYSSSGIKDNINKSGNQITDAENELIDSVDYNAQVKKLLEDAQNINQFTSSELYDIESAGNAIGSSYENEIAKAQRAKESGMGVSTIAGVIKKMPLPPANTELAFVVPHSLTYHQKSLKVKYYKLHQ